MKVNLDCSTDIRNSYLNITTSVPSLSQEQLLCNIVSGSYKNINEILEDNSCEEIIFSPFINKVSPIEIVPFLNDIKNKLIVNGKLILTIIDARKIGRAIFSGEINLQEFHNLVFGANNDLKSVLDISILKNAAKELGFNITSISQDNFYIRLELIKNA
jgi:hypothetical protein